MAWLRSPRETVAGTALPRRLIAEFDDDGVERAIRYEVYDSPGSRGWFDVFVMNENNETAASLRMKEDCIGLSVCLANLVYNLVLIDLTEHTNYSKRVNL